VAEADIVMQIFSAIAADRGNDIFQVEDRMAQ
jgi:hypothetical protein